MADVARNLVHRSLIYPWGEVVVNSGENIRQSLFCAELRGGQHLSLVVLQDDRLALMIDDAIERIWDADELGTNGAVSAFMNTCRRTGTVHREEETHASVGAPSAMN